MSKNKITSDDGVSRKINLCSEKPTNDFTVYGDWIYLNGSSTVLIEYKVCTIKIVGKLINSLLTTKFSTPLRSYVF